MPEEKPVELSVEILKEIRDEVRVTNVRLDSVRTELSDRIDQLTHRVVESELRTATAIAELAVTVRDMTGVLRAASDLAPLTPAAG